MILPWLPQKGDTDETVEAKRLEIAKLVNEFATDKLSELEKYIAEFPADEGYAPTAKKDAVYSIVRGFLDWLTEQQK